MKSGRASQYDQMPGAFPSDDEEEYTEEDFLEMINDVTREIVNENDGSFSGPSRSQAPHNLPALPPVPRDLSTLETTVDTRAQFPGTRTSSANALRPSIQRFAEPESSPLSVIHGDTSSVSRPLRTHTAKARQSNTPLESNHEEQGSEKGPEKKANKRKNGLLAKRCATLRKTISKQGETKVVNGQLLWLDPNEPDDKKWKPAVVMDDIRKYILRQQDKEAEALGCSYLYPDEAGGEPYGETAFFFPHQSLGEAREARADLVFTIDETDQNNPQPNYDPGWMMYDPVTKEISDNGTVIVLSPADNPILNWKEISLCISPHMDGSKMEYIRRVNKAIRQQDIWARMPRWYWQKPGDPQTLRQISSANAMVNMPLQRFRQKAGCLTWADRGGSDELELGLKSLLNSTAVGRQCSAANSMRGFGRDLNGAERLLVKRGNADGKFLKNAGDRAVDEKTRNERRAKEDERIAKAVQAEISSMPASSTPPLSAAAPKKAARSAPVQSRKRDRSDDEDDSEGSEHSISTQRRPHKRIHPARKEHGSLTEDDDLAMFDQPQLSTENPDPAQRHQLRNSARQEVIRDEHVRVEEPFGENSPEEGKEYPDDQFSGAEAESEDDDDDAYTPDSIPRSVWGESHLSDEDGHEDQAGDQEEEEGDGHVQDPDDEGDEPETTTADPTLEDPYHQISGASNAKAKESDLEAHRRWVREFLYEDQEDYASSLERRRTTQPPARYPNAINPTRPFDATTSGINYSEVAPSTDAEAASLAAALYPTKKMFWEWTGQTVPQPDREKSYGQQYRELHQAFEDWWNKNSEGPLPILVGVMHWGSSVIDWEPVEKDAVYYEAYKKGHRAPRDGDGRIVDVPGPLLKSLPILGIETLADGGMEAVEVGHLAE